MRNLIKYSFLTGIALLGILFVLMICLPNAKHNAEDCTKKVSVLLDEGNVKEAIDCVLEYEGKFTWIDSEQKHFGIESSIIEVARHGIKTGLNEEVRSFIKKRLNDDYSGRETVGKIVSVCLELDRYDMAKLINEDYGDMYSRQIRQYLIDKEEYEEAVPYYKGWYDSYIKDVVTKMCMVNKISEARKFLKAKINLIQDKEDRQKTLNELNVLINSY